LPKVQPAAQLFYGLTTEEDGNVQPRHDVKASNMIRFPLKNVDLCVKISTRQPLFQLFVESRDSSEWSILAQLRFQVGSGDINEQMQVVDGDVFRFGKNAEPITVRVGDPKIGRLGIELRYIYKKKSLDFEIVPFYSSPSGLSEFDTEEDGSIKVLLSGNTFYPDYNVMALHNLDSFGRGNDGEYFPKMTVELRNELTKNHLVLVT